MTTPMANDTLYIDNTILTAWKKCRLSATLTYILGYDRSAPRTDGGPQRPMNLKLQFGTAFHEAKAIWLTTKDPLATMEAFRAAYEPFTTPPPDDDRYSWLNARDLVAGWLYAQQATPSAFTAHPGWVEQHLEVPLYQDADGAIIFVSRPDALGTIQSAPGTYALETKTTGSYLTGDWPLQWEKSSQLTSQLWAIRETTHQAPAGILVHALHVGRLPTGPAKCRDHGTPKSECRLSHVKWRVLGPYIRSDAAIASWRQEAIRLALDFRASQRAVNTQAMTLDDVPEDGQFDSYGACQYCSWREWCVGGKNPNLIAAQATLRPWDPRLGAASRPSTAPGGRR